MENPFLVLESDDDPIAIAARKSSLTGENLIHDRGTAVNLIALGKTGDGKSSLLNDMLGRQAFKHKRAVQSQTATVQEDTGFWAPLDPHMPDKANFGCPIRVIDTPGFGDSQLRDKQFMPLIQQRIHAAATPTEGGLHCILMVYKVTASAESVMLGLETLRNIMAPSNSFWKNVILVFTHADASNVSGYRGSKVALKAKVSPAIKERFHLDEELPMVFLSTQKYMCSFFKGHGNCDCVKGSRYHADCRRRFFEQVWRRRDRPFFMENEEHIKEDEEEKEDEDEDEKEEGEAPVEGPEHDKQDMSTEEQDIQKQVEDTDIPPSPKENAFT